MTITTVRAYRAALATVTSAARRRGARLLAVAAIAASTMTPLAIGSATGGAGAGKTAQHVASLNWGITPASRA